MKEKLKEKSRQNKKWSRTESKEKDFERGQEWRKNKEGNNKPKRKCLDKLNKGKKEKNKKEIQANTFILFFVMNYENIV